MAVTSPAVPTPAKIMLGEGIIVYNYGETDEAIIGATRGGGQFDRTVTFKDVTFDGAMGPVKGLRRKTQAVARLVGNMLELATGNLTKYYAGLKTTTGTTYDTVSANSDLADTDYYKNVAFVGQSKDGKEVVIILKNALGDGNVNLAFKDGDEVVAKTQWTAHYDSTTPTTEPWEIRWPK
jgi:hypothetical protein